MKLFSVVMRQMSLFFVLVLTVWAALFYVAVMEEVNDEVDDALEDYSEGLMIRALAGEDMPEANAGSNNQYYLNEVTEEYAASHPAVSYHDEMVYLPEKKETEPARVLTSIFRKADGGYMELVVYIPTIEKDDLKQAILEWIVFLYVTLLLVLLCVNVWTFRKSMKPLYVLLNWLKDYRLGGTNKPLVNDTCVSEFCELNEAVQEYSRRSEKLFEQQKLFIGNASHEMQTPLAICINRLEMLMDDDSLSEKQMEELFKTHHTLLSLTRMNRSLLLLCKIDNGQYLDEKEVCFNDLVERYLPDYMEVYAYCKVNVITQMPGSFKVCMNESLASILFTNLLKNAFLHGEEGGELLIHVSDRNLVIANSGKSALDEKRVFERFYQGGRKEGSTGLGLALVSAICKKSGLQESYEFKDGMHRFVVCRKG